MTKPRISYVQGKRIVRIGPRPIDLFEGFRTLPRAMKFALWCVRQRTRD